jgi:sugar (pentulose or hexulose) kinase
VASTSVTTRDPLIVAIDLGTSACKVVAFDAKGRRIAYGRRGYSNLLDRNGRIEQSPATWWSGVKDAVRASGIGKFRRPVAGYAISTLRAAVLPLDARGRPLGPAILAPDTRASAEVNSLSGLLGEEALYRASGLKLTSYASLPRILWLKRAKPQIFSRTASIVCAQDYLIQKLCGRLITDYSHASRTMCLNIRSKQWDSRVLESSGLSCELFPELVDPGSVVGELSRKASRTLGIPVAPVIAAGGDQMCASVGLGAVSPEGISINHGTGSFIERLTMAPSLTSDRKSLTSIHVLRNRWIQEFPILKTGQLIADFIRMTVGPRPDFVSVLEPALRHSTSSPRSHSLFFLPYQSGSTAPHWNPHLPGVIWGLRSHHRIPDVLRCLVESILFDLRRCLQLLNGKPQEVVVGGQLTRLRGFNQMQADIFGLPVTRPREPEATALGAAVLGAAALGFYPSAQMAAREMVHLDDATRQFPTPGRKARYQELFDSQSELLDVAICSSKG